MKRSSPETPFSEKDWDKISKARPSQAKSTKTLLVSKDSTLYNRLSPEQIKELHGKIMANSKRSPQGCLLSGLPLDGKGGYPKSLRLTKDFLKAFKGHCTERDVTFGYNAAAVTLVHDQQLAPGVASEASHTCEHPWCVEKTHLLWEDRTANGRRKNCKTRVKCPCGCDVTFNPCDHPTKQCLDMTGCQCPRHSE